jgi:hypothetical protein
VTGGRVARAVINHVQLHATRIVECSVPPPQVRPPCCFTSPRGVTGPARSGATGAGPSSAVWADRRTEAGSPIAMLTHSSRRLGQLRVLIP